MSKIKAKHVAFNQTQMVVTDTKGRAWHRDHTKMEVGEWGRVDLPDEPEPAPHRVRPRPKRVSKLQR